MITKEAIINCVNGYINGDEYNLTEAELWALINNILTDLKFTYNDVVISQVHYHNYFVAVYAPCSVRDAFVSTQETKQRFINDICYLLNVI